MPPLLRRVIAALRSRKLAVALIALVAVYGIVGTLVPLGDADSPVVTEWAAAHPGAERMAAALGLHHTFTTPPFLILVTLLTVSTAACAVERTRRARRLGRGLRGELSDAAARRLVMHPEAVVTVRTGASANEVMNDVRKGLSGVGLRVAQDDLRVDGRAGITGLVGSPIFHWSLVCLAIAIALGQATRAEGFLALPVGEKVADLHANYLQISEGPWFAEAHTGIEFLATDVARGYKEGAATFGAVPYVEAYRDGALVASGRIRPNSPMRIGSLMVHRAAFGPAATFAIETSQGVEIAREVFTLDTSEDASSGTLPQVFTTQLASGQRPTSVRVQVLTEKAAGEMGLAPGTGRALIETSTVGSSSFGPPVVVAVDDLLKLPEGYRLRVVKIGDWARMSVANDRSVYFIYAFLVTAIVGLAIAVLVSPRRASVLFVEDADGRRLHVGTWHARRDPLFKRQVLDAVRIAAGETEKQ